MASDDNEDNRPSPDPLSSSTLSRFLRFLGSRFETLKEVAELLASPSSFFQKIRDKENVFLRRVIILISGSFLAQALPILIAPALSRLFSPDDMGRFGLFAAAASIGSLFVNLRYESAILLPEDEADAAGLLCVGVALSLFFSTLFLLLLWADGDQILSMIGLESISSMWLLVPLGVFTTSIVALLGNWSIRMVRFSKLALARVSLSASTAALQVGSSLIKANALSLVVGQIVGQIVGIFAMGRQAWLNDKATFASVDFARMKNVALAYRRLPIFSLPADLSNALGVYMPLFVLGSFFDPAVVGFYALTQRVSAAPVALVGNNVLEVFRERAASDHRKYGNCISVYRKTFLALFLMGLPPSLVLFFFAPSLFEFVFGQNWRESGEFARLLAPLLLVRFVATPLNYVLQIAQKQNMDLLWQLGFVLVSFSTIFVGSTEGSPRLSIGLLSGGLTVMYALYIGLSYCYAKGTSNKTGPCR